MVSHKLKKMEKRIFKASVDVFATNGYEKTFLHEIAKKAGIPISKLRYMYKNRHILLNSVIEEGQLNGICQEDYVQFLTVQAMYHEMENISLK